MISAPDQTSEKTWSPWNKPYRVWALLYEDKQSNNVQQLWNVPRPEVKWWHSDVQGTYEICIQAQHLHTRSLASSTSPLTQAYEKPVTFICNQFGLSKIFPSLRVKSLWSWPIIRARKLQHLSLGHSSCQILCLSPEITPVFCERWDVVGRIERQSQNSNHDIFPYLWWFP